MRILVWHVHGSWTTAFVEGRHDYLIPVTPGRDPDGLGRARTWNWPSSAREVTPAQLREETPDVVAAVGTLVTVQQPAVARTPVASREAASTLRGRT